MILFYVTSLDLNIASVRYRALLPAMYLNRAGISAKICSGEIAESTLRSASCIVFAKAFNATAVELSVFAKQLRIPIVLDLCDDIFEDNFGELRDKDLDRHFFRCMATLASSITTTTEVLANVIRTKVPSTCDIHIIPDMVEKLEDVRRLHDARSLVIREGAVANWKRRFRRGKKRLMNCLNAPIHPIVPLKPRALSKPTDKNDKADRTIIWFGNHGSSRGNSGMAQLSDLAADFARLSQEFKVRLVIISNSRKKFDQVVASLPIETEYLQWSPTIVFEQMKSADVCIVPFTSDKFGKAKSPNRIILALSLGVPVVCSDLQSLGPLRECVLIEDWYTSLKTYLTKPTVTTEHLERAQEIIKRNYAGEVIAEKWRDVAFDAGGTLGDARLA